MGIITNLNIAQSCDFGSQMSQYAALRGISEKTGLEVAFISEFLNQGYQYSLNVPFKNTPNIISLSEANSLGFSKIIVDETKIIDDNLFNLNSNFNYVIEGLVHSYSNFHHIKEKIIDFFDFKDEIKNFCLNYISKIKQEDEMLISIHFRRGDYVSGQFHCLNLSLEYYKESINIIKSSFPNVKFKYLIFSNGIDWVKENFKIENCIYVEGLDRYKDMCLMTLCDHNIIANSSFSWWGAYLNKNLNKKVICPHNYLPFDHILPINGNYFPLEWTAIKIY